MEIAAWDVATIIAVPCAARQFASNGQTDMTRIAGHIVTRTAPNLCPSCGSLLSAATAISNKNAVPKEGDPSVCLTCRALLVFDADLKLRLLSEAEFAALPGETRFQLATARASLGRTGPSPFDREQKH